MQKLKDFDDNSFDALITDPPAGISFMGKHWDKDKGGRDHWIVWMQSVMQECLRVLKPGAHGLVWTLPRTSHWTATALENAGFEIRDVVVNLFGSGFPKSSDPHKKDNRVQKGLGTALKPAHENWILIRKPLGEKTVAKNVLEHRTGALNIDASRIESENVPCQISNTGSGYNGYDSSKYPGKRKYTNQGRFPANLLLSHHPECKETCSEECAVKGLDDHSIANGIHSAGHKIKDNYVGNIGSKNINLGGGITANRFGDTGGASRFFYQCHPDCAVKGLDDHSGQLSQCGSPKKTTHDKGMFGIGTPGKIFKEDEHGASRFFWQCHPECAEDENKDCNTLPKHVEQITCKYTNANIVKKNSGAFQQIEKIISIIFAQENAELLLTFANHYQHVSSAENSVKNIETKHAQELVKTLFKKDLQLLQCLDFILEQSEIILPLCHAIFAEIQANTDIMKIIQTPMLSFGFASYVTDNIIILAKKDQSLRSHPIRFIYQSKASRKDRGEGNVHPTVKSTKLMEYLIKLITPPNGRILDPFAGSGSTLVAAKRLGFEFAGIEQDPSYCLIAKERLENAV